MLLLNRSSILAKTLHRRVLNLGFSLESSDIVLLLADESVESTDVLFRRGGILLELRDEHLRVVERLLEAFLLLLESARLILVR